MWDIRRDDRWLRQSVALLELSAGVLSATPAPSRRTVRTFAEVQPLVAVSLAREGPRLLVREVTPDAGTLTVTVVLEYYLHLVHDHLRACRLASRRPGGMVALSPGEQANLADALEEIDRVLHGAAGRERLEAVWAQLPAAV